MLQWNDLFISVHYRMFTVKEMYNCNLSFSSQYGHFENITYFVYFNEVAHWWHALSYDHFTSITSVLTSWLLHRCWQLRRQQCEKSLCSLRLWCHLSHQFNLFLSANFWWLFHLLKPGLCHNFPYSARHLEVSSYQLLLLEACGMSTNTSSGNDNTELTGSLLTLADSNIVLIEGHTSVW